MPGLGLRQPQPRRAPLGQAEGVAGWGGAPRGDYPFLHGRALSRRQDGLAQTLTGPRRHGCCLRRPGETAPPNGHAESIRLAPCSLSQLLPLRVIPEPENRAGGVR